MQQGSRDQLKAPSRRSSPKTKKKRPASRRKHKQDATTKGVVFSITRPAEKGKGFRELRRMADELTAEIESIQDAIKAHMTAIDADTLTGTDYKITWKTVTSSRFDSTAFKKAMPELAERFTKSSTSRRFTVA